MYFTLLTCLSSWISQLWVLSSLPVHGNQIWSRCFVILHSTHNTLEDLYSDIISFLGDILTVVLLSSICNQFASDLYSVMLSQMFLQNISIFFFAWSFFHFNICFHFKFPVYILGLVLKMLLICIRSLIFFLLLSFSDSAFKFCFRVHFVLNKFSTVVSHTIYVASFLNFFVAL